MAEGGKELITVRESKFGKGLFAKQDISLGSTIISIKGEKITFNESVELGDDESYCLQVGIDKYIIPEEPFIYSNHSCDPNSGINQWLELFALRPIGKGDEITWDYSSSMLERHWTMRCSCSSPFCRQLITDFDLLPKQIQESYLRRGIVFPYIIEYLKLKESPLAVALRR
jgi:hypothetical protein